MQVWKKIGTVASLTVVAAVSVALAVPASADTAAEGGDAVGVGSDTLQNGADFVFDGSPGQVGGFNTTGAINRADNVFATGDANGRAVYDGTCGPADATGTGQFCNATTNLAPNNLIGSVILRAGQNPVIRPNGSGQGVAALIADSGAGYNGLPTGSIQFARMSRLPNSTEEGNCPASSTTCGGLHVYQAATDTLGIARVTTGFDGPTGLSAQELASIYTCNTTKWNQLPGNSGGSSATIHPLIPQTGSGTRNFFLADLAAAAGTTTVTPGTCTRSVQEHDPTGIYADSSPADAIEPFSGGKLALINSGYFANGVGYKAAITNTATPNGAYTANYLSLESGTPGDSNPNYNDTRGLFFTVRQVDVNSTTPFEPGGTQNFVTALFSSGASAIRSASGKGELAQAGFTAAYKDCGVNPTTC